MKPIEFDKSFIKAYKKRIVHDQKLKKRFGLRFARWQSGERSAPLFDHALGGNMLGLRAFSVSGDVRVIYYETDEAYVFTDVSTHAQVYGE